MPARDRFIVRTEKPTRFWIGTGLVISSTEGGEPIPATLIALSDNLWQSTLLVDVHFVTGAAVIIVLLSLLFWCPFIYRITHSLAQLTVTTERIAQGHFDTQLTRRGNDEIGRLSEAVNLMADRLNSFVYGQRRFLGGIAHELFSPLARLQAALQLLDESVSTEHKDLILDIREEVDEMNDLVHEVLAFSKAGLRGKQVELDAVNLRGLFEDLLKRLGVQEQVQLDVSGDLNVLADSLLLERSISNIVRNSIRYAGEFGPIFVTSSRQGTEISVVIADNGPGVPEEALKHLGEPFFRSEPSRTRSSGGLGLGLAIVKSCVNACGGSVLLRNRQGRGFEVEVRLKTA